MHELLNCKTCAAVDAATSAGMTVYFASPWYEPERRCTQARLRRARIVHEAAIGQIAAVLDPFLILIAAVFALAGFVKGVIGLGLPTVSIGLLAVAMPPAQALAIVIVPAIVTNIWQTFVGPYLKDIIRRLWPLMLGTAIGIRAGSGLMTGPYAGYGTVVLGGLFGDLRAARAEPAPLSPRPGA